MRAKWPKECPVFEVLKHSCAPCPEGGIVVGTYVDTGDRYGYPIIGASYPEYKGDVHNWYYALDAVRPLTPAAREMLAIAKERR